MQKFPSQHFSTQAPKNIKNPPRKKFLIFSEIELSSSNMQLSSSYIFLKESSYISRNETLYFSAQARKKKEKEKENHPPKVSYTSGNGNPSKISYIFSKVSCSCISRNGAFLCFRKGIFRIRT